MSLARYLSKLGARLLSDGKVPTSALGAGAVLQAVQFPSSFVEVSQSTRDVWTDAGFTATITPSGVSSKILVIANAYLMNYGGGDGMAWAACRVKRNGSVNLQQRELLGVNKTGSYYHVNTNPTLTCLDSPNTTSQVSYNFEFLLPTTVNGQTITPTMLRSKFGPSDGVGGGSIILLEIAG